MEDLENSGHPQQPPDPLQFLKQFTDARIAIGRAGHSIPAKESLAFKLAHAHARDAVYAMLDVDLITTQLEAFNLPIVTLQSKVSDRIQYLQRPDHGRRLNDQAMAQLNNEITGKDVVICIADGLSAVAIHHNIKPVLDLLIPLLLQLNYTLAPLCLIHQGRVAIADDVGESLLTSFSIIFIGERPGLSAADSMSAYLTYHPKQGLTDDARNCISNIRPGGLSPEFAVRKIIYLMEEAFRRKLSGIALKDNEGFKLT
jgi:ethanolamine ammonia-lyase small subunit